jgi:PAS domain S-box-containing protein
MTANWQRAYYLIAALNILGVGVGLYLTHQVTIMFETSIAGDAATAVRGEMYLRLDRLASDIVAPGNDVFADGDVEGQERRLEAATLAFNRAAEVTRAALESAANDPMRETMLADLAAVRAASVRMVVDAREIFVRMRQGPRTPATQSMAAMDRNYARLTEGLAKLRQDAIAAELTLLEDERWAAQTLRWYQGILGAAILLVIAASGVYGQKLSTRARAQLAERESYITRLRESEATLEQRVLERTDALRAAEERLRLAARATNDALWDWEISTDRIWGNTAFAELFGEIYADSTTEFRGRLIHPDDLDRVSRSMQQFLDGTADVWSSEYRFRRAAGTYAWVLDRGYLLRNAEGKPRRMIGSMMDITERKEAERMKSDFVSFVSHQLRTPLAGMNWMLELASDSDGLPETARDYIRDARESAERLVTLVNNLLDIARLESGRTVTVPEPVCLRDVTRSVLREMDTLITERGHAVHVDEYPAAAAWADAQLIRQVITNLLSNAVKYTPERGRIAISLQQHNGTVQWSVADSGVGIPRVAQDRLFERFYRADNAVAMEVEGTGLGLHLVRLIVEQSGGRVWCESEEGHGAIFSFTLPVAPQGEAAV